MADDFTDATLMDPNPSGYSTSVSPPPAPVASAAPALPTGPYAEHINNAAAAYGVDPNLMYKIAGIESSYNPHATTGSYHGLFQLSNGEFQRYVPGGSIWDPSDNANAAAQKTAVEIAQFKNTYGRDPTPTEVYMQHQQGVGGTAMHMAHPDDRAWVNMYRTAEGQRKGADWARRAVTGNMTQSMKRKYNPESITSAEFMQGWRDRVEGAGAQAPPPAVAQPTGMLAQSAGSPPIKAPAGQMRGALAPVTEPAETAAETVAQAPATATAENMTPEEITAAADKAKEEEGGRDIAGAIERARGLLEPDFKPAPLQPIKFNYWRPPPRGKA